MQKFYTLYKMNPSPSPNAKEFIPESLLAKHPNHAIYGDTALFCESLEEVTGTPADEIEDMAQHGLKGNSDEEGQGMKESDFDDLVDEMIVRPPNGKEIKMSAAQGKYLYKGRFKPEEIEGNPK